jgi:hypothetical protein
MKQYGILKWFVFFLLAYLPMSCEEHVLSSIPEYPVYLERNLSIYDPNFKNTYQTHTFEKREYESDRIGYGGIIVCIGYDFQCFAFDMCCPYELKATTRVHSNGMGEAVCDSCKSVFDIVSGAGNPKSGKAKEVLKRYKAVLNGDVLRVTR